MFIYVREKLYGHILYIIIYNYTYIIIHETFFPECCLLAILQFCNETFLQYFCNLSMLYRMLYERALIVNYSRFESFYEN